MALLRKYFLPHLEKLCKNFLETIIRTNARTVKLTTLNIFDQKQPERQKVESNAAADSTLKQDNKTALTIKKV